MPAATGVCFSSDLFFAAGLRCLLFRSRAIADDFDAYFSFKASLD